MVKLNLSAIQNAQNKSIKNDNVVTDIIDDNLPISEPEILTSKKKLSLISLISGAEENVDLLVSSSSFIEKKEELDNNELEDITNESVIETKKSKKVSIKLSSLNKELTNINDKDISFSEVNNESKDEIKVEDLFLKEQITNKVSLENIEESNKEVFEEKTITGKQKIEKKEEKSLNISDGDTSTNLIVGNDEIFSGYVSTFEKELELIKSKNNKSKKEEKNRKIEILTQNSIEPVNLNKDEIDLDKIIEETKILEKKESIEKTPLELNLDAQKNTKKINFNKNYFIGTLLLVIFSVIGLYGYNFLNKSTNISTPSMKVNVLENSNNTDKLPPNYVNTINASGIINTGSLEFNQTQKDREVKQNLIKYFKNKQNNAKID